MIVKWYVEAVADLDKIYDYYVKKSPRAAALLYNKILDDTDILATQPYIAAVEQILEGYPENYRSLVVANGKYKVVYFIKNDTVLIVQVFNCRRNPARLKSTTIKRRNP